MDGLPVELSSSSNQSAENHHSTVRRYRSKIRNYTDGAPAIVPLTIISGGSFLPAESEKRPGSFPRAAVAIPVLANSDPPIIAEHPITAASNDALPARSVRAPHRERHHLSGNDLMPSKHQRGLFDHVACASGRREDGVAVPFS
jgi:hypothetical protein